MVGRRNHGIHTPNPKTKRMAARIKQGGWNILKCRIRGHYKSPEHSLAPHVTTQLSIDPVLLQNAYTVKPLYYGDQGERNKCPYYRGVRFREVGFIWISVSQGLACSRLLERSAKERARGRKRGGLVVFVPSPSPSRVSLGAWNRLPSSLRSSRFRFLQAKRGKRVRALGKKEQKSRSGGGGGGAGKERKRLPLSPDILPNAVRQRTGGNDALPLANRLSVKLIDQIDIRLTVYQR